MPDSMDIKQSYPGRVCHIRIFYLEAERFILTSLGRGVNNRKHWKMRKLKKSRIYIILLEKNQANVDFSA